MKEGCIRKLIRICTALGLVLIIPAVAMGVVTVDPDAFPSGTVLNNAYPGVTLTAKGLDISTPIGPDVLSLESTLATTGTHVFGNTGTFPTLWGDGSFDWLEVRFDSPATQVSLDFIANDDNERNAVLKAWDASDTLLDTAIEAGPLVTTGQYVTLTVTASDIAYVTAEGDSISYSDNWALDNLKYEPNEAIPAPGAIFLGSIGVGFVGWLKRRRTL